MPRFEHLKSIHKPTRPLPLPFHCGTHGDGGAEISKEGDTQMGCASSRFLDDEDGGVIIGAGLSHHIVSLTSTTYGLLTTLDQIPPPPHDRTSTPLCPSPPPPPPPPPPKPSTRLPTLPLRQEPEVINSWDLMAGLDPTTTTTPPPPRSPSLSMRDPNPRLPRQSPCSPRTLLCLSLGKENSVSNRSLLPCFASVANPLQERNTTAVVGQSNGGSTGPRSSCCYTLEMFPRRCPPGGENAAVIYTTTLRGIRKTFDDCNAVRAALAVLGVSFKERDVSMDMGFREELRELLRGMAGTEGRISLPRVFVRGRHVGGAEEVLRIHEEGGLEKLLDGLPRARPGHACDGCGGVRFLPCFRCSGGKKLAALTAAGRGGGIGKGGGGRVVSCPECNENGLVVCPICC